MEVAANIESFAEIQALLADELQQVEQQIEQSLSIAGIDLIKVVGQHLTRSGGKRIRPVLALLVGAASDSLHERHHALGAVVELIHTATLLHDDVVDDSSMRRGKDTANLVWGNSASILVGDFLFSRAFQIIVSLGEPKIMELFATATREISEGEVMQLVNAKNHNVSEALYLDIIRRKTATLFSVTTASSAILSGSPANVVEALQAYGAHLGVAFQLMDDVLDYEADAETLGKQAGDDLAEGKLTLPLLVLLREADQPIKTLIQQVLTKGGDREALESIRAAIIEYDAMAYVKQMAEHYTTQAKNCLKSLPESVYKQSLQKIADFTLERKR